VGQPPGNHSYVEYGRWDAEHHALVRRVHVLERFADRLQGAEQEHRAIVDRIAALEAQFSERTSIERGRHDRVWTMALLVIGSLILPLVTTAIIAFVHLNAWHV